jgi:hypothetical protein
LFGELLSRRPPQLQVVSQAGYLNFATANYSQRHSTATILKSVMCHISGTQSVKEDIMKRLVAAVALLLLVSPATALERSPDDRGHFGNDGRGQQAASGGLSGRRDAYAGGGRERAGSFSGIAGSNRSFFQRERSGGQRGERN